MISDMGSSFLLLFKRSGLKHQLLHCIPAQLSGGAFVGYLFGNLLCQVRQIQLVVVITAQIDYLFWVSALARPLRYRFTAKAGVSKDFGG
jgi:hypothetical protein